ncbi:hypothetical protein [Streptomyces sp. NPDC097619]|uniref:hypothetical protein n=1 Tax=Streptomyces sp. NPDC097619 TaxID=3157228 RepID=UPI00331F5885
MHTFENPDPDWPALWTLAQKLAAEDGGEPGSVFEPIGLFLAEPGEDWSYEVTPVNSTTFAATGGDGVHYGFLHDESGHRVAVIMTAPAASEPHLVVGTSLRDFLALGCRTGYFSLEQLIYRPAYMIAQLQADDHEQSPRVAALLSELVRTFALEPWPAVAARLSSLDTRLRCAIQVDPDAL